MTMFLALSNTYNEFAIALFRDSQLHDQISDINAHSSKQLIPLLDDLLKKNNCIMSDIQFIAVNQGPGPFTTLRSILATANGLSFATGIPLVGVDGMQAFVTEHTSKLFPHSVALFNAFNKDVYYGIQTPDQPITIGYKNYEKLLAELHQQHHETTIRFIGAGVELYRDAIVEKFSQWASIPKSLPEAASVTQIGLVGLKQWNKKENISKQLMPLYLKTLKYKKMSSK